MTPLHLTCSLFLPWGGREFRSLDLVRLLLERGAGSTIYQKDREGRTVLDHVQHPRTWVGATRTNTEMKPLKALLRKHFTIVIRKCVIGGNAEHPSRNRMKHLAPRMASFLI